MRKRKKVSKTDEFNNFRFNGLNPFKVSDKFITMNRVSEDKTKIVVKVADNQLIKTKYGYGLIANQNHIIYLKSWQLSQNYYGNEVLLDKNYFKVMNQGVYPNFSDNGKNETWEEWLNAAQLQSEVIQTFENGLANYERVCPVRWTLY